MREADCVLAFSFGNWRKRKSIVPGPVNVALAQYVAEHFSHLPLIAQWEIHDEYRQLGHPANVTHSIVRNSRRPDRYLDTRNVAEQGKMIMAESRWRTAVIVAHRDHLPRAAQTCKKVGIKTLEPSEPLPNIYDRDSAQLWTRSEKIFLLHEAIANPIYRVFGYL